MSDENETKPVTEVADETKQETSEETHDELTKVGEVDKDKASIPVDLWGVTVDIPIDKAKEAKELIKERDSRSAAFRDLSDKVKEYEQKVADTARQLEAAERAKAGQHAEAEALYSQKAEQLVGRFKNRAIKGEILDALTRNDKFLDTDSTRSDAIALITSNHEFKLNDDDTILSVEGKSVKEVVDAFVETREAFQKASRGAQSTGGKPATVINKETPTLSNGLKKFLDETAS